MIKPTISNFFIFSLILLLLLPFNISQAAVTNIAFSGTNVSGSSVNLSTELGDAGDASINFTLSSALSDDGDQISFTLNGAVIKTGATLTASDLTLSDSVGAKTLEAFPGTADNGSYEVSITNGSSGDFNPIITITLDNGSGPIAPSFASGVSSLVIADDILESSAVAGNYALVVQTPEEIGIGMLYVGDSNDVSVTATVDPYLTFVIRDSSDASDTNVCNLGTLTNASVSTCAYRLALSTNAANGFQVQLTSDGALRTVSGNDINAISEGNTVVAGTEGYGIAVTSASSGGNDGASNFTEPIVENGAFADDDTPIPTTATNFISFGNTFLYNQGNTATSTLITHRASIDAGTASGTYSQLVTYTVTATF